MRVKLKEDPKEWRKSTWLTLGGVALLSSVLRWRHILAQRVWLSVLALCALIAVMAWLQPRWFRGYYRVSTRAGFWLSQALARVILVLVFLLLITPLALLRRILGKDSLRLKRLEKVDTYWLPAKPTGPLDRLF